LQNFQPEEGEVERDVGEGGTEGRGGVAGGVESVKEILGRRDSEEGSGRKKVRGVQ
jgi:hypothetical protein